VASLRSAGWSREALTGSRTCPRTPTSSARNSSPAAWVEASIREITRETLEAYDYRVVTANDGVEALAVYGRHRGELAAVLTDLRMPAMGGEALVKALEEADPGVRVVVTSGLDERRAVLPAAGGKARAFLQKPYTAHKLLTILREVLSACPVLDTAPGAARAGALRRGDAVLRCDR
jgi:CheY-like chemotaxis protein